MSHNPLLTIHFWFCLFRYFPSRWLFPWCCGSCITEVWHSSYWHSKKIRLRISPSESHQGEWREARGPLDNYQTVAWWLWLWKHKKSLPGVMRKAWCWISWYESLHMAHLFRLPCEYFQRWVNSKKKKKKNSSDGLQKPNSAFIYTFADFLFCLFSLLQMF